MRKFYSPLILLFAAFFAYGLLMSQLGFYWDDLPMSWIRYQLGFEALTKYFSTNRPVWAWLYQITTRVFPQEPIYWQIFALIMRWLGALTVFGVAKKLFPQRESLALPVSLIFLLYTGFNQQSGGYLYSHFFIVLFFFLFSYYLTLRGKTIFALIFSALNLWMMEYFFTLELMRPFVIWISLADQALTPKERLLRTLKLWTPYLAVFTLAVFSRIFIFNNTVYTFSLKAEFVKAPLATIYLLAQNIFSSLWAVTFGAWAQAFQLPSLQTSGPRTLALYACVVLTVAGLTLLGLQKQAEVKESGVPAKGWILLLGLVMLILAGPPFWLTNLPVSLGYPANRATLSFMLGSSFVLVGLLEFLPNRLRSIFLITFIAFAAGRQFLWANDFRRDWEAQKNMFWQMTWRAPGLEKNTTVLLNETLTYYADNSLSAALNWIYAPDETADAIGYALFYPTNRAGLSLTPNAPVMYDFLVGKFNGNTSQSVAFYYAPPKCLRLLDPEIDSINKLIPEETLLREAAALSSTLPILATPTAQMPKIYQPEPAHGWCYYFQKADLARQLKDWGTVARLGGEAFKLDDHPNDPIERFVFIEGYAHTGNWEKAVEYSLDSYRVSKAYMRPLVCKLWERIARETESAPAQANAISEIQKKAECVP
ncbi:MAG: hypothetical protein IT310_03290 [Anaerolineales bacterium]|nr:hypothetical protein [Anaerolineales bacterium]